MHGTEAVLQGCVCDQPAGVRARSRDVRRAICGVSELASDVSARARRVMPRERHVMPRERHVSGGEGQRTE